MSHDKHTFTLKTTPTDKGIENENKVTGQNNTNLLNGLKGLNLGVPEGKPPIFGQSSGGLSLNDLAKAHLNQNSNKDLNTSQTSGLKLNIDFNNLKLGQPTNLGSSSNSLFGQSSISLSDTKQLPNVSLSALAKEHETKKPVDVATASGFKIPSLFGNTDNSIGSGSQHNSSTKDLIDSSGLTKPNIDLSSALLTKEERSSKSASPKGDLIEDTSQSTVDKRTDSSQKLISSIDLLISSSDTEFDKFIKNEKTKPSPFGYVLCRKWKENRNKVSINNKSIPASPVKRDPMAKTKQIKPFLFDVPSPDDIIIAAQSRVFGRRQ